MFLKRTLVAAAFVVGTAVSASAADIPMAPMAPPPPPPMAPAFDWSGPYVGAFTGYTLGPAWIVGAQAGYNWQFDRFVVGLEGRIGVAPLVPALFTTVSARAGFLVAPKFLIYGAAGVGYTPFVPAFIYSFGGGMEYAVSNSLSLFLETRGVGFIGAGCCTITVQGGLNWHF